MKPESIDESYEESQRKWCRKVKFKSPPRHEIPDIVVDLVVVHVHQLGDTDELNWKWKSINLQNKLWKWNEKLTFKVIKNWNKRKEVEEVLVEIMMKKHLDEHKKQVPKRRGSKIMTVWWKKAAFLPLLYLSIGKKMLSLTIGDVKGRDFFFFEIKASREEENRGSRTGNGKLDSHLSGETILEAHEWSSRVGWEGNRQNNRAHRGDKNCFQSFPAPWSFQNFLIPSN